MRKVMVAALMVALSGCIGVPTRYEKTGANTAQFETDKTQCLYEAKLHQPQDPFMWPDTVSSCLQARGWRGVR